MIHNAGPPISAVQNSLRFFYRALLGWALFIFPFQAGAEEHDFTINGSSGGTLKVGYLKKWEAIDKGIGYNKIIISSGESFVRAILKFVRLDPALVKLKILASGNSGLNGGFFVRDLAEKTNAALVINGGYFDENGKPLGFLVSDGAAINKRVATNWIYSGLFYVKGDKPFLVHREDFQEGIGVEQAIQAGPYLMANGSPLKEIKNLHASHFRSGIGITRDNEIFIFATDTKYSGVSWHELQQILSIPDLHCAHAMNLDGGGSTQMALSTAGKKEYIDGTSKIPVAIGFFKK